MGAGDVAVLVADGHHRSTLARLAAVGGVTACPVTLADAPLWWASSDAVVVDEHAAQWCREARLPRRGRVLVATAGAPSADTWSAAVAIGADEVLDVSDERRLADWFAVLREPAHAGRLVCCVPARGGAGASTLSAVLALAAASQDDVLLLDADPHGGGLDYVLGIEDTDGARWADLADAAGVLSSQALTEALPATGRARVVSHGRGGRDVPPVAFDSVLGAALRGHPLVVADAAGPGEMVGTLTSRADVTVVVVPAEVRGVVAATSLVGELAGRGREVLLVVRHPGPGDLRPRDVADAVGAPVAAVWPWERRLGSVVEGGLLARGWRRTRVGAIAVDLLPQIAGAPT
jgi:secretion/DNA translocation related CpaE-like protein